MIGRVYRGTKVAGLLRYLYGPGRCNEHNHPHLVASWDGGPEALEPALDPAGAPGLVTLTALLEQPLAYAGGPPDRPIWHCALRAAPGDRVLTDAEWADVAQEVMHATGIAPRGDDRACRWVAVRHAEDHIHVAATLAREDGSGVRLWRDFVKLRGACRAVEDRYCLRVTAEADGTVPPCPTRAEVEKTARRLAHGPQAAPGSAQPWKALPFRTPREQLRVAVRRAAAAASDPEELLDRLRSGGVLVKERRGNRGELTGYAVAVPGDCAAGGAPVFYGGGRLAADLSLPRLQHQWPQRGDSVTATPPMSARPAIEKPHRRDVRGERVSALLSAARAAEHAAHELRAGGANTGSQTAAAAAMALAVAARLSSGAVASHVLVAADLYEHASQASRGLAGHRRHQDAAAQLARATRGLARSGSAWQGSDTAATAMFLRALSALVDAVAGWHVQAQRHQQAAAAQATAGQLRTAAGRVQAELAYPRARIPRRVARHDVGRNAHVGAPRQPVAGRPSRAIG